MPSMDNHDHPKYQVVTGQTEPHAYKRIARTVDEARTRDTRVPHAIIV